MNAGDRDTDVLQALYDSEINFKLSAFWDGGFDWWLGDPLNGYRASGSTDRLNQALAALQAAAVEHYPTSVFTLKSGLQESGN